ncbi:pilin [Parendozoicomonas haliclonae]|uniref:Fimbrial protein n=1 Tax=Parendozoicomonas haliclonae TaxID=1960125 RepID=A0A1X7ADG5_9GAMM|nr:pilin [Parendozoicomonas haliclonae]SMA31791.1 Fimbrial protein precursor [Parendozoicomonas haliclonae]
MANRRSKRGFTLLEIMIVIGVIGILAAIAIPAYQRYTTRAKVAEIITIMSEMKASVSQCIQSRGNVSDCSAANSDIDETAKAGSSRFISSVSITAGVIRIDPDWSELGDSGVNGYIQLTPTLAGSTIWNCQYRDVLPSIVQYLPSNCRNAAP